MINSQVYSFVRLLRLKTLHTGKMMFINTIKVHFLQLFYVSGIYKLEVQWIVQRINLPLFDIIYI